MRFLIPVLFILLAALAPLPVSAATDDVNPNEYQNMQQTFQDCSGSVRNLFYDCQCVSIKHLDLSRRLERNLQNEAYDALERSMERERQKTELLRKSYDQCADLTNVAMMTYQRCINWAITSREDYNDFCQCFSLRYADRFSAGGNSPFFNDADARAQAITSCNANPGALNIPAAQRGIMMAPSPFSK
jgi:hypothetical protein